MKSPFWALLTLWGLTSCGMFGSSGEDTPPGGALATTPAPAFDPQAIRDRANAAYADHDEVVGNRPRPIPTPTTVIPEAPLAVPPPPTPPQPPIAREKPAWIEGQGPGAYSEAEWILRVGFVPATGNTAQDCENAGAAARRQIAEYFEVKVQSRFQSMARERSGGPPRRGADDWTQVREVAENTTVSSTMLMQGSRVLEYWPDKDRGLVYALAGLHRDHYGATLASEANRHFSRVDTAFAEAQRLSQEGKGFQALRRAYQAQAELTAGEAYRARLQLAGREALLRTPATRFAPLDDLCLALGRGMRFSYRCMITHERDGRGEPLFDGALESAIGEALLAQGLNVEPVSGPAAGWEFGRLFTCDGPTLSQGVGKSDGYLIACHIVTQLSSQEARKTNTIFFYKARGEAVVRDLRNGEVVARVSFPPDNDTKAYGAYADQVARDASKKGAEKLRLQLLGALGETFGRVAPDAAR